MASNEFEVLDPAATVEKPKETVSGAEVNRRHFMTALGVAGAAIGAGLVSAAHADIPALPPAGQGQNGGFNQTDLLNYLLNIKYLKATMYAFIATGADIPATYATPQPTLGTGEIYGQPGQVTFTGPYASQLTDMFNELFYDELNQVVDLQALLGAAAMPRPTMNLLGNSAPSMSGNASSFSAPPATQTLTQEQAIGVAQTLEDLSTTAFAGALTYLNGAGLALATQILATDGSHTGAVRLAFIQNSGLFDYSGTQSFSFTAGAAAGSNVIYGFLDPSNPLEVGYTISTSATIATDGDVHSGSPGDLSYDGNPSLPGIAGFTTVTAVPASIPSSYEVPYSNGSHHTNTIPGVSAEDAAAWQIGMPVYDSSDRWPRTGTFITAITPDGSGTYNVTVSASSGGHNPGHIYVGTSAITLADPFPSLGSFTVTTLGFLEADPNTVLPADIGAGVAATGPTIIKSGPTKSVLNQGFFATSGAADATTTSPAGLAFARSFSQVLAVLYASTAPTTYSGGYFPIGVGGSINVV